MAQPCAPKPCPARPPARLPAAEDGTNLQSWLLCVEMLPASILMLFAFPWAEYVVAGGNIRGGNITHAISIRWVRVRGGLCCLLWCGAVLPGMRGARAAPSAQPSPRPPSDPPPLRHPAGTW